MAPKKPVGKGAKKDEVIDVPKTSGLPDGKKTFFIGGDWSRYGSLNALGEISALTTPALEAGHRVILCNNGKPIPAEGVILPPIDREPQSPTSAPMTDASYTPPPSQEGQRPAAGGKDEEYKSPNHPTGFVPVVGLEVVAFHVAAAEAVAAAKKPEAEAGGEGGEGGAAAAEEEGQAATVAKKVTTIFDLSLDQSVVVTGDVKITTYKPPVIKAPPPPPEPVAAKAPVPAAKKGKAVKIEEAPVAAPPPPPPVEEPKGASPSTWSTISFSGVTFHGPVIVRGVHVNFTKCHFASTGHQLSVHQYSKVTVTECTFVPSDKACLYAFPLSSVAVTKCLFGRMEPASAAVGGKPSTIPGTSCGIQVDDAEAQIVACGFTNLTYGIVLNDKCAGSTIAKCQFDNLLSTGIYSGMHNVCEIKNNQVKQCGYYGLHFGAGAANKVLSNHVSPAVKIDAGAHPFLHSNTFAVNIISHAEKNQAAYLDPKY